jgi:uncharacterized membrane protein
MSRTSTLTFVATCVVALAAASVQAADVRYVQAGDVYWLWRLDRPNIRVTVREVDRAAGRAKVALPDGEVRWVSADDLKTRDEATGQDIVAGGVAVGALLLACAINPDTCKSSPTQAPRSSSSEGTGGFKITNNCRHPVRVAIHFRAPDKTWSSAGWWNVSGNSTNYLANSQNQRLLTTAETWYYYAETTNDANLAWKGKHSHRFGKHNLSMIELKDKEGDREWSLVCDGR